MVKVIAGDDRGEIGRVLEVDHKKMRILVEGVNIHTKHARPSQSNPKGGRQQREFPVHYSNVMLVDSDKKQTRIGIREDNRGGKTVKIRVARTNGKDLL